MVTELRTHAGSDSVAQAVRALAVRSHQLVNQARDGARVDVHEVRTLLDQIQQVHRAVDGSHQDELIRWLDNLHECLDGVREDAEESWYAIV